MRGEETKKIKMMELLVGVHPKVEMLLLKTMPGVTQHATQHTHTREIIRSLRTVVHVHDDLIVQLRAYIWTRLREWRAQYTNSPNSIFTAQSK